MHLLNGAHRQSGFSLLEILLTTCLLALASGACLKLENATLSQAAHSAHSFKERLRDLSWMQEDLNSLTCSTTTHWTGMTFVECQKRAQTEDQAKKLLLLAD